MLGVQARFRDVPANHRELLQGAFFITPVFWPIEGQSETGSPIAALNPLSRTRFLGRARPAPRVPNRANSGQSSCLDNSRQVANHSYTLLRGSPAHKLLDLSENGSCAWTMFRSRFPVLFRASARSLKKSLIAKAKRGNLRKDADESQQNWHGPY